MPMGFGIHPWFGVPFGDGGSTEHDGGPGAGRAPSGSWTRRSAPPARSSRSPRASTPRAWRAHRRPLHRRRLHRPAAQDGWFTAEIRDPANGRIRSPSALTRHSASTWSSRRSTGRPSAWSRTPAPRTRSTWTAAALDAGTDRAGGRRSLARRDRRSKRSARRPRCTPNPRMRRATDMRRTERRPCCVRLGRCDAPRAAWSSRLRRFEPLAVAVQAGDDRPAAASAPRSGGCR